MRAMICDRCGRACQAQKPSQSRPRVYTVYKEEYQDGKAWTKQHKMDLCEDCRAKLARWMEDGEDKQDGQD